MKNGIYKLQVVVSDANDSISPYKYETEFVVDFATQNINFSDIQFIESYNKSNDKNILNKSGYNLIQFVSDFFNESFK